VQAWVKKGCASADIGCVECKQPVIESVLKELKPIQERAREYERDLATVQSIINDGCEQARDIARDTIEDVRKSMGLVYR
jgi:tryptophanyl-tRNA synthetase